MFVASLVWLSMVLCLVLLVGAKYHRPLHASTMPVKVRSLGKFVLHWQ